MPYATLYLPDALPCNPLHWAKDYTYQITTRGRVRRPQAPLPPVACALRQAFIRGDVVYRRCIDQLHAISLS